ncbi:hypothetical protein FQB35_03680 [Crassaminicella thermophila]|uniref:Uncharacterized protein n=1 Tax=Crassaminicella thermophila TaxID=2599308 RepID=A0A5C0SCT0_CRATE|nr:hypothetical protein [Crassaminicella thermophila]QEK11546.1 hypothetical protein FQB35_03680 [Crassaminicella thermophila]
MFDKEYSFKGSHAKKVNRLTGQFDEHSKSKIFSRNIDVYIVAPLIGFLYGRKSPLNNEDKESAKIMGDMIIKSAEDLKYNLRLILLLDEKYEPDEKERINRAFKFLGSEKTVKQDLELFESYVRGGVDVLYEKIMEPSNEYMNNLYDFLEEFDDRFNQTISDDSIVDLCKLARS